MTLLTESTKMPPSPWREASRLLALVPLERWPLLVVLLVLGTALTAVSLGLFSFGFRRVDLRFRPPLSELSKGPHAHLQTRTELVR